MLNTSIHFNDDADASQRRVITELAGYTVNLVIDRNSGYPTTAVIVSADDDGDLVVAEADANGAPLDNSTFAIPLDIIRRIIVL